MKPEIGQSKEKTGFLPAGADQSSNFSYFKAQSSWGATKHMGGFKATEELITMCQITPGKRFLEVGCGAGMTTWRLAKEYHCSVVGVDLSPQMIAWSKKRVEKESVKSQTTFVIADATNLPFLSDHFDIVLSESVTAFPREKQAVINEYARLLRPGGFVGINEGTWLYDDPPENLVEYVKNTMENVQFLTAAGWEALFKRAELVDIRVKVYKISMIEQWKNQLGGLRAGDKQDTLRAFKDFFSLSLRNPEFRKYARSITPSPGVLRQFFKYLGYGLYVGKKV